MVEELKRRLTKELQKDVHVKILESLTWNLPVRSIDIEYETIKKSKMDILMKMMLIALQKGSVSDTEELSELLLVEPLFINDLIAKMQRTGILVKNGPFFALTAAGVKQLETGVFENEPEQDTRNVLYSPSHQSFLVGEWKEPWEQATEDYRYSEGAGDWNVSQLEDSEMIEALRKLEVESVYENTQIVVSDILSASDIQVRRVSCIEFRLRHVSDDILYARVWNTLTEQWDEQLEAELNEKERKSWREQYK
ncbi:hypothetical protein AB1K83_11605 [Sporosarcina sp. 179-K 3D1 HS]|uniref:hypothetical protein n=1 Tax=Sporosarcina sp. 179-K 3D1 HS TaxID=3232169 RepID=UPI0039A0169A